MTKDIVKTTHHRCDPSKPYDQPRCVYSMTENGGVEKTIFGKCFPWVLHERMAIEVVRMLNRRHADGGYWTAAWVEPNKESEWDSQKKLFRAYRPQELAIAWWDPAAMHQDGASFHTDANPWYWLDARITELVEQCLRAKDDYKGLVPEADEKMLKTYRDHTGEKTMDIVTVH